MQTNFQPRTRLALALAAGMLALATLACSFGSMSIQGGSAVLDLYFDEAQVNRLFDNLAQDDAYNENELLQTVSGVEMHDGFIRVLGSNPGADGAPVAGSFDASFSAANDALQVQIIAVDIPGLSLDSPRIVEMNRRLAQELAQTVSESNGEVLFKGASVTDGKLWLKIQVNLKK